MKNIRFPALFHHPDMLHRLARSSALAGLSALCLFSQHGPIAAEPAWTETPNSRVRLIAGPVTAQGGKLMAGVHIQIEPGWKTYWRNPGDSGVPPRFDWTGSGNVKQVVLHWPVPERFVDTTGSYIGYQKEVVFPVEIVPEKAGAPVNLELSLEFAVCKDICIPVESNLRATLVDAQASPAGNLVERYFRRVPRRTALGSSEAGVFHHVEARLTGPKPALTVDVKAPGKEEKADLFVEAPDGMYLPLATRDGASNDGTIRFTVDLAHAGDPKALKGRSLRLTLRTEDVAYEADWLLK